MITDVRHAGHERCRTANRFSQAGTQDAVHFHHGVPRRVRARTALHDGAVCFLSKPFDTAVLIRCVEAARARPRIAPSKSLYKVLQPRATHTNLRRIDSPPRSNYPVIEVAIHEQMVGGEVMSDSTHEEHATAFEPRSYAMRQSVDPPAFEGSTPRTNRDHARRSGRAGFPPNAVTRRSAR